MFQQKPVKVSTKIIPHLINKISPPIGDETKPLKALLIDSWYDNYLGIIILVKVINGQIEKGQKIYMMMSNKSFCIEKVGIFAPKKEFLNILKTGEIGFITANIKNLFKCKVGDTIIIHSKNNHNIIPLAGFKTSKPVVFSGLFPIESQYFQNLKKGFEKLQLNDASFTYETETSSALGYGFRCGFLGLLHLEIIKERLEREFKLELINTSPSVIYRIITTKNEVFEIQNPGDMPPPTKIRHIEEPWAIVTIIIPDNYLGSILKLCTEKRGIQIELKYLKKRVILKYKIPLNEIIINFYDKLKSH